MQPSVDPCLVAIGDYPPGPCRWARVTRLRLRQQTPFRKVIQHDLRRLLDGQRFSFQHQDCLFIVINSMLINSKLEEEQEQWDWLEQTLQNHAGDRVFIFSHYQLYL